MKDLNRLLTTACIIVLTTILTACSSPEDSTTTTANNSNGTQAVAPRFNAPSLVMPKDTIIAEPQANAYREAYFGDLHVHTDYSFDAYAFGTVATPYDAYRYAQGEAIAHPAGFQVQLGQPLDFYAVTDHAMFLGAVKAAANTSTVFSQEPHVQDLHNINT
ncbi:MAG: DUF3604 domain-containing protein, partial [Gammaproteobacteria bacterium]|nr:DUF3604 domain-containing protein [Gammaproteobacteria bacterium]